MKHSFTANSVVVECEPFIIALGQTNPGEVPLQSLLLSVDDEQEGAAALWLELNGQANACSGADVDRFELFDDRLSIYLRAQAKIHSGTYDHPSENRVTEIAVDFQLEDAEFRRLLEALRGATLQRVSFSGKGPRVGMNRPPFSTDPLFEVLDRWASFFLSRDGKVALLHVMVDGLKDALIALPENLKSQPGATEILQGIPFFPDGADLLELDNRHPFNMAVFRFLKAQQDQLPEVGREILRNVEKVLRVT